MAVRRVEHEPELPPAWRLLLFADLLEESLRREKMRLLGGSASHEKLALSAAVDGIKHHFAGTAEVLQAATVALSDDRDEPSSMDAQIKEVHSWCGQFMTEFNAFIDYIDRLRSQRVSSLELEITLVVVLAAFDLIEYLETVPNQIRSLVADDSTGGKKLEVTITVSFPLLDTARKRFERRVADT